MDVIVVGAGASGMMAAIVAARKGAKVLIIEHKEKAGKKIYATGNGKCNYTNLVQTIDCYRSDDIDIASKSLELFDVERTLDFFYELGIVKKERKGYCYPNSEQAGSIVSAMLIELNNLGVEIHYEEEVLDIIPKGNRFEVITNSMASDTGITKKDNIKNEAKKNDTKKDERTKKDIAKKDGAKKVSLSMDLNHYEVGSVILAAGGCASKVHGSDGSGLLIAQKLGLKIVKPLPALVALKSKNKALKALSGVRIEADVTLVVDGKTEAKEYGEIIFTDYGISGIPIFQVSRFASKALEAKKQVEVKLDFLPDMTFSEVESLMEQRLNMSNRTVEECLTGLFNSKLNYILLRNISVNPVDQLSMFRKGTANEVRKSLAKEIKGFTIPINGTNPFEQAQVCCGGVKLTEINPNTMETVKHRGLFLCGEMLDVDGTCGGYNLQWAWTSGYLAGNAIK